MSMLAERKRKQKWSLNPRGKVWAQDTNKFGFKMLEKMGWSHGKGLGAKEDGMIEHVKVGYKNDSKGIGYKESDDQWTEHESNFSALLEALGGGEHNTDEIKLNSLEEKSQNSKARVHYRKFTRGKDLSKYSEKDLANIFGKRNLKELKKAQKQQEEQQKVPQTVKEENQKEMEKSSFFSNAGLISDYFKRKLPNFGKTNGYIVGNNGVLKRADESESESEQRPSFGFGFKQQDIEVTTEVTTVDKEVNSTFVVSTEDSKTKYNLIPYNYTNCTEKTPERRNKKKRNFDMDNGNSNNLEDTPSKKKKLEPSEVHQATPIKKKKNKSKTKHDSQESGLTNPAFDPLYTPVKMEKHILETIEETMSESLNETLNDTVGQVAETFEVQVQINNESTPLGTPVRNRGEEECDDSIKHKKKKKKDSTEDMNISYKNDEVLDISTNQTKKKKKRKDKINGELEDTDTPSRNVSKIGRSSEDCINLGVNSVDKKIKKKDQNTEEMGINNQSTSKLSQLEGDYINYTSKKDKKKKTKASSAESFEIASTNEAEITPLSKKKSKTTQSQEGVDNPLFNISSENDESALSQIYNPYEVIPKEKKKKRKNKEEKESYALENPVFNEADNLNSQDVVSEEFEVSRKDKSKKKKGKRQEEKGIDNPALNLNGSVDDSGDLMLNIVATPVTSQEEQKKSLDNSFSIQKVHNIKRRKSVRFSDVTRERIIPNKEESEQETLEDSSDVIEIEGKLNDSSELSYIDKFIQKRKSKKKNKGLDNTAFDKQANIIEENITSMSKTLDSYEAEIENDMNEAKLKTVELQDIMVGEVGNSEGPNEVLPDGTVKLMFKNAKFNKSARYIDALAGAKKSYKHLIKGNIVMQFRDTNLHEIKGYSVKDS